MRFAQPRGGKIAFIFETELEQSELSTVFDADTPWIDVTDKDCEVGNIVKIENGEYVFCEPSEETVTLEEIKGYLATINSAEGNETVISDSETAEGESE